MFRLGSAALVRGRAEPPGSGGRIRPSPSCLRRVTAHPRRSGTPFPDSRLGTCPHKFCYHKHSGPPVVSNCLLIPTRRYERVAARTIRASRWNRPESVSGCNVQLSFALLRVPIWRPVDIGRHKLSRSFQRRECAQIRPEVGSGQNLFAGPACAPPEVLPAPRACPRPYRCWVCRSRSRNRPARGTCCAPGRGRDKDHPAMRGVGRPGSVGTGRRRIAAGAHEAPGSWAIKRCVRSPATLCKPFALEIRWC